MKSSKIKSILSLTITMAIILSSGGYLFADEVEETEASEETESYEESVVDEDVESFVEIVPEEPVLEEISEEPDASNDVSEAEGVDDAECDDSVTNLIFEEYDEDYTVVVDVESFSVDYEYDNDYLAEQFILQEMNQSYSVCYSAFDYESLLSGYGLAIYNCLYSHVHNVAYGLETSTEFNITNDISITFTAEDLGLSDLSDSAAVSSAVKSKLDLSSIVRTLLCSCPYELYWFDKTIGYTRGYSIKKSGNVIVVSDFITKFTVAEEYQDSNASQSEYAVSSTYGSSVRSAAQNASAIIDSYSALDDYHKLMAYKNEICSLVSYNYDALGNDVAYGNPWQLVWVFDGIESTKVVCEGYSKAFQYLCDNSEFQNDIYAISVYGSMVYRGSSGGHMWNIVHMEDGNNYLVDVTNCDTGFNLFLVGATGDVDTGYTVHDINSNYPSDTSNYYYNSALINIFSSDALTLSDTHYEPPIEIDGIEIDSSVFPDDAFRTYISEQVDSNSDGYLITNEIQRVVNINVDNLGIESLEGLELFSNLQYLSCKGNQLTSLNVSANVSLRNLLCDDNALTEIDVSNNGSLIALSCAYNQISEIDVTHNPNLVVLYCHNNSISELNLSACPSICGLVMINNNITTLDISNNPLLIEMYSEEYRDTSVTWCNLYNKNDSAGSHTLMFDRDVEIVTEVSSYTPGWNEIDGKYYYADDNGNLVYGWLTLGSSKYYLSDDGARVTGWQEIEGSWYYFKTSGAMITGWKTWGSKTYYFDANGVMLTGWQDIEGNRYYFKTNGTMIRGWKTWGSKTYYFGDDGVMRTGWQDIDGNRYYFKTSGVMVKGWKVLSGKTYYFDPVTGAMYTGLQTIDGKIYYFKTNGIMLTNTSRTINGIVYDFGPDGACTNR